MIRIKLAILDSDETYINRISNAFNANYSDKLELFAFTQLEAFIDFVKDNKVDVVIASDSFELDTKLIPERTEFAYFVDSPNLETLNNKKVVCKFTKIDNIYKAVLNLYSENPANVFGFKQDSSGGTKIMSFYPCSGGNGASVLAAACSINLAAKGKKVLYLNLEQFGVPGVFFNAEGAFNLSDLIYAIKSKKANVVLKLESSVKEDKSGVYFFDECKIPLDFMELTSEDVKKLIDVIKSSSLFDYIIIDTDMLLNDVSKEIMMYSDRIIFASSGTENSNLKFSRIYKTLEIVERQMNASLLQKISVIYNKFNNTSGKYIDGIPNLNILGCVGEFNRSASALIARQISQMQIFDNI